MSFEKTPGWLDWYGGPSKPRFLLPTGSVDAHCHVFGPGAEFPFAPERKYTPCDASAQQLFALRDHLGFARNVIVQATCHGADNSALVAACRASNGRARGVATVRRSVGDADLLAPRWLTPVASTSCPAALTRTPTCSCPSWAP